MILKNRIAIKLLDDTRADGYYCETVANCMNLRQFTKSNSGKAWLIDVIVGGQVVHDREVSGRDACVTVK